MMATSRRIIMNTIKEVKAIRRLSVLSLLDESKASVFDPVSEWTALRRIDGIMESRDLETGAFYIDS